jgi:glutathione S-transferase
MRLYDYAASANCYKVRLLLAHLGLEYERVPVDIFAGDTLTPEYAAKNPSLSTPVLEFEPGRYLPESAAILLFLAEGSDLLPAEREARAQAHRWLFYEQSTVLPTVAMTRFRLLTGRLEPGSEQAGRDSGIAAAVVAGVDNQLRERAFIVDNRFTVADIALFGYLHVAGEAGVDTSALPRLDAWLERVRSEPGHVDDLEPYPENARPGKGRSIWDALS